MRVIAGTAKGTQLKTPDGMLTRPTTDRVKEALFSILQFDLPSKHVLDLFGGTGQLGIEAISRGAASGVFVDMRRDACNLIRENLKRTHLEGKSRVIQSDYLEFLTRTKEQFDIIFLDPPYAENFLENAIKKITEIDILHSGGIIVTERPSEKPLSVEYEGYERSKDYRYGKIILALYRKK